jgi:glutathione S-transferase
MADPVLYSFRRCPYAIRARMALIVSGTAFTVREVDLKDKPAELKALSPKATVPVLLLPGGAVIDESLEIMRWALSRHDPEKWLEGEDLGLIQANDGPFKYHLDRYKYAGRYGAVSEDHRAAALDILFELDARLTGQPYLHGPSRALTDAALMPFVRQFAATDRTWFNAQDLPNVQRWLADQLASPLFEQAMRRVG